MMTSNETFCEIGSVGVGGNYTKSLFTFNEADTDFLSTNDFVALDLDGVVDSFKSVTGQPTFAGEVGDVQFQDLVLEGEGNNTAPEEGKTSDDHPAKVRKKRKKRIPQTAVAKTFHCDLCDGTFNSTSELKYHISSAHQLAKVYRCEQCLKEFNFRKNLFLHIASHSAVPAACPECGKVFQRISSFLGHLKTHAPSDNFRCQACGIEFEFEQYYDRHLSKVHGGNELITALLVKKRKSRNSSAGDQNRKYACKTCGKRFPKPCLLRRHEIAHAKVKPFVCVQCNKRFSQKSSLDRHSMLHSGIKPFDCPVCNMRFSQRTNLITHINRVHTIRNNSEAQFPCDICSCVFNKLKSLNRHKTLMHSAKANKNEKLSFTEILQHIMSLREDPKTNSSNLPSNNQLTTPSGDQIVPKKLPKVNTATECTTEEPQYVNVVDSLYPNNECVSRTVKEVCIDGVKWLECPYCPKRFQMPFDIVRHLRVHTKEKPFECEICCRKFALKSTMNSHMRIHRKKPNEITKLYHCTYCQKSFDSIRRLDMHVPIHSNYKPYICPICFKTFKSNHILKLHKTIHQPKNPDEENIKSQLLPPIIKNPEEKRTEDQSIRIHQCIKCRLGFKKISHLKQHELSHLNQKTFECNICHKFYSTKSSLGLHNQTMHSGNKTIPCEICNKLFYTKSDLKRHEAVHNNFRNFMCPYCKKTFKAKSACKKHITLHIKDVVFIKDVENVPPSIGEDNACEIEDSLEVLNENQPNLKLNETLFSTLPLVAPTDISDLNQTSGGEMTLSIPADLNQPVMVLPSTSGLSEVNEQNVLFTIPPDINQPNQAEPILSVPPDLNHINHLETIQTPQNIIQNNPDDVVPPCNVILMIQPGSVVPEKENTVLQENENVIYFDLSAILNTETPSTVGFNQTGEVEVLPPTSLQPKPLQPEFISISELPNYNNKLTKNIVVVSHEKNPNSCDSLPEIYLSDSEPQIEEFLIKEASAKIAERAKDKIPKMKAPHLCVICKKIFQKRSDLVRHTRTHTKEKPFRCDICSKAFSLKSTLENHKITHEKDRPTFECHVCGKKYAAKNVLNIHLRLHTGERPFKCEICTKTFRTSGHMKAHNRMHAKAKMEAARKKKRS